MRLLVCGDRAWQDAKGIKKILATYKDQTSVTVIHGGKGRINNRGEVIAGADLMADRAAKALGYEVLPFPAHWAFFGKGAGPRRNKMMLSDGRPNKVIAFHDRWEISKGTYNMLRQTWYTQLPMELWHHDEKGELVMAKSISFNRY